MAHRIPALPAMVAQAPCRNVTTCAICMQQACVRVRASVRGTGVGAMLISRAKVLLAEDGLVSLGLAVTAGNPAQRTYEEQGFSTVTESQTVLLPPAPEPEFRFPSGQSVANSSR